MAQVLIAPSIITREIDLTQIPSAIEGIGPVIIGKAERGPAFVPTRISSFAEYNLFFGSANEVLIDKTIVPYQAAYATKNYLKNASALTFVRTLGHNDGVTGVTAGYTVNKISGIVNAPASSGSVLAIIHHSASHMVVSGSALDSSGVEDDNLFRIYIGDSFIATASFQTGSDKYIGKVLNSDPTRYSTVGYYLDQVFPYQTPTLYTTGTIGAWTTASFSGEPTSFEMNYTSGSTSWVKSQDFGGTEYNLFRFHTLGHGRIENDYTKVSIKNIKPSSDTNVTNFGSFDVVVRDFFDTDERQNVFETFTGLNLDPNSSNFILSRIGNTHIVFDSTTRKLVTNGTYPNKSRYIFLEMNDLFKPEQAVPWGFRGYTKLSASQAAYYTTAPNSAGTPVCQIPSLPYVLSLVNSGDGFYKDINHFGVSFVSGGINSRMRILPSSATTLQDTDFSLKHLSGTISIEGVNQKSYNTNVTSYTPVESSASIQKFTMPFVGGFDGFDRRTADPLFLANNAANTNLGVVSLKRAISTIANPDQFDINLLAVPGVHATNVANHVREVIRDRRDFLYIMDITGATSQEAVDNLNARSIDDSYIASYYPDINVRLQNDDGTYIGKISRMSPSVAVMGVIAFNDRIKAPWFAPAGFNRGGLQQFDVVDVVDVLDFKDRQKLFNARINAMARFTGQGAVVYGQETLNGKPSSLSKVSTRRMLLEVRKGIATIARRLQFDFTSDEMFGSFTRAANAFLDNVKRNFGVEKFKVIMDNTTTTEEMKQRSELAGKIFIKPSSVAEVISIDFILTNAGTVFEEV